MIGGYTSTDGKAVFGKRIAQIPARRTSDATKAILDAFKTEKQDTETFLQWVERAGTERLKKLVEPFQTIPTGEPLMYEDLGDPGKPFKLQMGKGECAA